MNKTVKRLIDKSTGELVKVGTQVQRYRPNRKGFRPAAVIVNFCPPEDGMVWLRFPNGNVVQAGIKQYNLKYIDLEVSENDP